MSVSFDNKAETSSVSAASLTLSSFVMGSNTNRATIVIISFGQGTTPASLAINWNTSETLTAITGASVNSALNVSTILGYGLTNPTSGTHSFTATWTGAVQCFMGAISVSGADQTGGTTTFAHGAGNSNTAGNTGTSTITVTSGAVGNMTIAGHLCGQSISAVSDTQAWIDNAQSTYFFGGNYKASASGSNILTATYSPNDVFDAIGFDIVAVAGAAGVPYDPWPQLAPTLAQKHRPFVGWNSDFDHRRRPWRRERGLIVPNRDIIRKAA